VNKICNEVKKGFNKQSDKCDSVSKDITKLYFSQDIEKVIMYVMKFSTSDSFMQIINENFIDLGWEMAGLETLGDNYGS